MLFKRNTKIMVLLLFNEQEQNYEPLLAEKVLENIHALTYMWSCDYYTIRQHTELVSAHLLFRLCCYLVWFILIIMMLSFLLKQVNNNLKREHPHTNQEKGSGLKSQTQVLCFSTFPCSIYTSG